MNRHIRHLLKENNLNIIAEVLDKQTDSDVSDDIIEKTGIDLFAVDHLTDDQLCSLKSYQDQNIQFLTSELIEVYDAYAANDKFTRRFAVLIAVSIFLYLFCVTFIPSNEINMRFADGAFGFVISILSTIIGYYYGSSKIPDKRGEKNGRK